MDYSSTRISKDRKNRFSSFWFNIVKTRFLLCLILIASSLFIPKVPGRNIIALTTIYILLITTFGLFKERTLHQKRVRVLPAIIDIGFASVLTYFTGGPSSPWFVLYFFPIISVSRYLSYEGSIPLAVLSITAYSSLILVDGDRIDFYSLTLKCMAFFGIALVAGNLTRARQPQEDNLIEIFKDIDNEILKNTETDKVLRLILEKAMAFTGSDMGQMKILGGQAQLADTIISENRSRKTEWNVAALAERYYEKVIASKKAFSIFTITGKKCDKERPKDRQDKGGHLIYVFVAHAEHSEEMPRSALFVPLILNERVRAIIALYSKNRLHYSQSEAIKLGSFAQLLGLVLKNSEMYQEIKERLRMLYEIAEQLKVEQGLSDIFRKVVDLACSRLNSEEAALFIWDEENNNIKKEAVKGPSEETTAKLKHIEKPYKKGESLVGRIFENKELKHLSLIGGMLQDSKHKHLSYVPAEVEHYDDYSKTLPSGKVHHYLGVPLIIGEEVLGVIRVINKRGPGYSVDDENFALSGKGFDEEDVELMQTIASQVASAIRSAKFIEVQHYYQELVENSPDPIIVLDRKGKVKVFNKACETIWGFKADEVIGDHVTSYYESEQQARAIGELLENSPNKRIRDYPSKLKSRRGEVIPILLSACLLFDKQGMETGSIGVFKDLRETIKLQEEKTNAERLATLGKLAHTVGHEIKHDIATALNYVDTLAYESTDDEELSEIYRDIQESLSEAIDKFQNMLMVGRPRLPEIERVGAEDIFRKVEATMRRRADSKKIEFLISYPDSDCEVNADVTQLRQVLINLFDNSIDAIETKKYNGAISEKGRIELSAQVSNGDLQIIWKDNGCGISPQKLQNIFTPFVTDKTTGNGLGLFIVKSIIENHDGNVSVDSVEGKETTFNIFLPLSTKRIQLK